MRSRIVKTISILLVAILSLSALPQKAAAIPDLLGNPGGLANDRGAGASPLFAPGELLVRFAPGSLEQIHNRLSSTNASQTGIASLDRLNAELGVYQIEPLFKVPPLDLNLGEKLEGAYRLKLPAGADIPAAARRYAHDPAVVYAEPNYIYTIEKTPNDPMFSQQWSLNNTGQMGGKPGADIHAVQAWDIETGITATVIAIIDTGVDWDHPDLAVNIWKNRDETAANGIDDDGNGYIDDTRGWDFVSIDASQVAAGEDPGPPDNNPMDFHGHGTHVSGIAAAVSNNGKGVAGVCWRCSIMPLRAGYVNYVGSGAMLLSDAVNALVYAADNGARVVNMSFGGYDSYSLQNAVAYAQQRGVLMVAAAGNYGTDAKFYPASYPEVLAVAATDINDQRATWGSASSDFGDWVDVAAPGSSINSTLFNDTYAAWSGTSMASPHVAGLAGLLFSHHPSWTAEQIRSVILSTADTLHTDEYIGSGRMNAYRALSMTAVPTAQISSPWESQLISTTISILGTASATNFSSYRLEAGAGYDPQSWTLIAESSTPVNHGLLGSWNPPVGADGPVLLRLKVNDSQGNTTVAQVAVLVESTLHPGWPQPVGARPPVLADVNGDGRQEIIVASLDGKIYLWQADGTSLPGWPKSVGEQMVGGPTAVDLDGDGKAEILAASLNTSAPNFLHAWRSNGAELPGFPLNLGSQVLNPPAVADINGDGRLEIVASNFADFAGPTQAAIFVWKTDGTPLSPWPRFFTIPPTVTADWSSPPALGDLDRDGKMEILVGFSGGTMHVFRPNGFELLGWPVEIGPSPTTRLVYPVAGDVNKDGKLEVVASSTSGEVHLWKANAQELPGWPASLSQLPLSPPTLVDLDGDGDLETIVHCNNDRVYAWHHTGTLVNGWPVVVKQQEMNPPWPQLGAADVDGDGKPEVIASSDERRVNGWNEDGTVASGWPKYMLDISYSSAALGEVDGDGKLELVAADQSHVYVWDLSAPATPSSIIWGMAQHDAWHTGLYGFRIPQAGLALSLPQPARAADPGTQLTYSLVLTNTGNITDTFTIRLAGNAWNVQAPAQAGPLIPGASLPLVVTVQVPAPAAAGVSDTFTVTLSSKAMSWVHQEAVVTTTVRGRLFLTMVRR